MVEAIPGAEYPTPARRPAWSVLDNSALQQALGIVLPPWQDGLKQVMAAIARG
ncbi:sugar nucleotide-binding protein [Streptococcus pyogenes]